MIRHVLPDSVADGSLFKHIRTHSEKSFQCVTCGKYFAHRGALTAHERLHLGLKPSNVTYAIEDTGRNDENIAKIKRAIDEDRRKTIDEVSEETNLSWSTVQRILTEELHMRRVSAKFVPSLLTDDERENRVRVCRDLMSEMQNGPNFLKRIVTGDECYGSLSLQKMFKMSTSCLNTDSHRCLIDLRTRSQNPGVLRVSSEHATIRFRRDSKSGTGDE
ncbi:hypothetical protein ANN_27071 [Periplaneta americana]|uniref:C2H2-type domain-containing protein n=1 Tax=Periplaneta americana TaxID=6978 RepID=A0ABQ8RX73_PERAM|nr:hypothetical protein ANN_27071 [Periplaneta americana]